MKAPNDEEWKKLTDPTKIPENFFPKVDLKVSEKISKEEYIEKLKKNMNEELDI